MSIRNQLRRAAPPLVFVATVMAAHPAAAQVVTFRPYIQPGDNGAFGPTDQMIVAWLTDEAHPVAAAYSVRFGKAAPLLISAPVSARVVDDYSEERLIELEGAAFPMSWSPGGLSVVYEVGESTAERDLWVLPLSGDRKPSPLLHSPFGESHGQVSPDGHWIAYYSNETRLTVAGSCT